MPPKGSHGNATKSFLSGLPCTVDDCEALRFCKSLCAMHYYRLKKYGDVRVSFRPRARNGQGKRFRRVGGRTVPIYRLLWEEHHGKIPKGMHIHHVNGDHWDNRIENLALLSREEHSKYHHTRHRLGRCRVDRCVGSIGVSGAGLGYCARHYRQIKKHGRILAVEPIARPDRFRIRKSKQG